ncbi:MAG: Spy0128 family protein [Bacillota bacterium]
MFVKKAIFSFLLSIAVTVTMIPSGAFALEADLPDGDSSQNSKIVQNDDSAVPEVTDITVGTDEDADGEVAAPVKPDEPEQLEQPVEEAKGNQRDAESGYVITSGIASPNTFNHDIKILDNVSVNPATYEVDGVSKEVLIRVVSATPSTPASEFDSSQDYDPETSTLNVKDEDSQERTRAQVTYTIELEAYVDDQVLTTKTLIIDFFDDSQMGPSISSDVAYIRSAVVVDTVDGTASFDAQDGPGYDSGPSNKKVRSFDTVINTLEITNAVYKGSAFTKYESGNVGFEFVLKGTSKQVEFAEGFMTWLESKQATYKVFEVQKNGETYQVMRGEFLWESGVEGQPAICAASMTVDVAYTVLAMKNTDKIQPDFTFWMEYNDVPQSDVDISSFPTSNYVFVKDYTEACETHNRVEPVNVKGDEIEVSAAPWYNAVLKAGRDMSTQAIGYWDLKTGKYSLEEETSTSIYGRSHCYGLTLQIRRPDGQGIKGCELPNGDDITVSLNFSECSYLGESGATYTDAASAFKPVLWSVEGNRNNALSNEPDLQEDGRELPPSLAQYAYIAAPFNKKWTTATVANCYNGGTWQGTQSGSTVDLTVSGYEVDIDKIPRSVAGDSAYVYWPENKKDHLDIYAACFSAGEIWFVTPFYEYDINGEGDDVTVSKGRYVTDALGEAGSFSLTTVDGKMYAKGMSGQEMVRLEDPGDNSNQTNTEDDAVSTTIVLHSPGNTSYYVFYQEYGKAAARPLTQGCMYNGKDWIMAGGKLSIAGGVYITNGDPETVFMAADIFVKFDDAFFDIEGAKFQDDFDGEMPGRILYAAKSDGSGWDHQGKAPDEEGYDDKMKETVADGLIYYSSLDALKAAGKTCVGVLGELRHGEKFTSNCRHNYYLIVDGKAKNDTANMNKVFMVTNEGHSWRRDAVMDKIQDYYGTQEPTQAQMADYMWNVFPSHKGENEGSVFRYGRYPQQAVYQMYPANGLKNYKKVVYNEDGSVDDPSTGYPAYADSCLVVGYKTGIAIDCAQTTGSGKEKIAYDMDTGQRVVDYVIRPRIEAKGRSNNESTGGSELYETTVTIETTLPAKLHYIPDSSYRGGTYTQTKEGRQGIIEGGELLDAIITENDDGTTTIKYSYRVIVDWNQIEGDIAELEPVYFSCDIGDPGTGNDVENNEQLTVTTAIESTEDCVRPKTVANGNLAEQTIHIAKGAAVSLVDRAEHVAVDTGKPVAFTSKVVNESVNPRVNAATIVHLPMDGYSNTHYTGERTVTEFSVPPEGYTVWYTTDTGSYSRDDYTAGEINEGSGWHRLTVGSDGKVDLTGVDTSQITAFAVIGDIPEHGQLDIRTELSVPDDKAGDFFQHWVSLDGLTNYARTYVVKRSIRGLAWADKNEDGLQSSTEMSDSAVAPITVTLLKLRNAEGADPTELSDYDVFTYGSDSSEATVQLGESLDLVTNEVSSMSGYQYDFTNMPEGTYALRFNNDDENLANRYHVTKKDVNDNANDEIDSDADYQRTRSTEVWGVIDGSYITGIELPKTDAITTSHYISRYNDLGISTVKYDLELMKTVETLEGSTTDPDADKIFTFLVKTGASADSLSPFVGKYVVTTAAGAQFERTTSDGEIKIKAGEVALIKDIDIDSLYKVTEVAPEAADGYIYSDAVETGTMTGNMTGENAVVFTNKYKTVELPVTKTWSNYDGTATFEATVTLSATVDGEAYTLPDGITTSHTFTSETAEDSYTFEALPAITPDGKEISYSVSETAVSSETVSVSKEAGDDAFYVFAAEGEELYGGGTAYRILGKWVPTVTSADGTVAIVNAWTPATLEEEGTALFKIRKVDEEGNLITSDIAQFKVEKKGENDSLDTVGTFETMDGVATVTGLEEGEYVISEVKAPDGYLITSDTFEIKIDKTLKLKEVKKTDLKNILQRIFGFLTGTGQSDIYSWDGEKLELSLTNYEKPEANLEVTKSFTGRAWNDADEFTFTMEAVSGQQGDNALAAEDVPMPSDGGQTVTVSKPAATADGQASSIGQFGTITYDAPGTYVYRITEEVPVTSDGLENGITYDDGEYMATVEVTEHPNNSHKLIASVKYSKDGENAGEAEFVNKYNTKGEITFSGTKTLEGGTLTEGQFSFELYDQNGELLETVSNTADGSYSFSTLKYTGDDLAKGDDGSLKTTVKQYRIVEKKGNDPEITYDDREYNIIVTLEDDEQGTINVTADPSETSYDFTNVFTPADSGEAGDGGDSDATGNGTKTGDSFLPLLSLFIMLASGLLLMALSYRRRRD